MKEGGFLTPGSRGRCATPPPVTQGQEGGMASVMHRIPPRRRGVHEPYPPDMALAAGEGRDPGQLARGRGRVQARGVIIDTVLKGGFLTPGWDEAGPVPTQGY